MNQRNLDPALVYKHVSRSLPVIRATHVEHNLHLENYSYKITSEKKTFFIAGNDNWAVRHLRDFRYEQLTMDNKFVIWHLYLD